MGSVSIRRSIQWFDPENPSPASEPTYTHVLTSPSRYFVDIRIFRSALHLAQSAVSTLASDVTDSVPVNMSARGLDWGIAGTSESTDTGLGTYHGKWNHWIDSRSADTEGVSDEGEMSTLPDGSTSELGQMINPDTGKLTPYEEIWEDPEVIGGLLRGGANCLVLKMEEIGGGKADKGMCIVLGGICQCIARTGEDIQLEQWFYQATENSKDLNKRQWKRTFKIGALDLPCRRVVEESEGLILGSKLECAGRDWKVVEIA